MMLKKSILKITFLSASATLLFVFWNAELMRQYDYYDESYNLLPFNHSFAHVLRKLLYMKKDYQAEIVENYSEYPSQDAIVNYLLVINVSENGQSDVRNRSIELNVRKPLPRVIISDAKKIRLTTQFLFKASSSLTRPKDTPFSPIANFASSKSSVCLIPKNGHSVVRFVNCLLVLAEFPDRDRSYKLFNAQSTFDGAFSKKCDSVIKSPRRKRMLGLQKIAFIRDPLERFVSGWLFLCKSRKVCFNCGLNFRCFLTTLYNCWKSKLQYSKICKFNSPSRESPFNTSEHLYWHLSPQSSFCYLHKDVKKFQIIKYSKTNINEFLLSSAADVIDDRKQFDLYKRLDEDTMHASTWNDSRNLRDQIISDKNLTSMFAQLYFVDYKTFSIALPQFIIDFRLYDIL